MSYPQGPPGSPGYPPAQQPTTQFSAPTQQFGRAPEASPSTTDAANKLPTYLAIAVALLGTAGATSAADACIGRGPLICC